MNYENFELLVKILFDKRYIEIILILKLLGVEVELGDDEPKLVQQA